LHHNFVMIFTKFTTKSLARKHKSVKFFLYKSIEDKTFRLGLWLFSKKIQTKLINSVQLQYDSVQHRTKKNFSRCRRTFHSFFFPPLVIIICCLVKFCAKSWKKTRKRNFHQRKARKFLNVHPESRKSSLQLTNSIKNTQVAVYHPRQSSIRHQKW
jgi:hypothetical protein